MLAADRVDLSSLSYRLLYRAAKDGEFQGDGLPTKEVEAIGGKQLTPVDWEARQAVDSFVEMGRRDCPGGHCALHGEALAAETHEDRGHDESRSRNVAVTKSNHGTDGGFRRLSMGVEQYESEEEMSEADDEDDPDLMSMTEDRGGVRELAINDWARTRILEGHWLSPADQWYSLQGQAPPEWSHPPHIPARHPCPWNVSPVVTEQPHPPLAIAQSSPPPSLQLCSAAFEAYKRQMRSLLLPAMINHRSSNCHGMCHGRDGRVCACSENGGGGCRESASVSGVWYNGTDWVRERDEAFNKKDEGDDSSVSSKSGSEATSPVLSTSTLQTTPSPPPATEDKKEEGDDASMPPPHIVPSQGTTRPKVLPIAISPVLESPTQIPSIPYIPETVDRFPQFTIDSFKSVRAIPGFNLSRFISLMT